MRVRYRDSLSRSASPDARALRGPGRSRRDIHVDRLAISRQPNCFARSFRRKISHVGGDQRHRFSDQLLLAVSQKVGGGIADHSDASADVREHDVAMGGLQDARSCKTGGDFREFVAPYRVPHHHHESSDCQETHRQHVDAERWEIVETGGVPNDECQADPGHAPSLGLRLRRFPGVDRVIERGSQSEKEEEQIRPAGPGVSRIEAPRVMLHPIHDLIGRHDQKCK